MYVGHVQTFILHGHMLCWRLYEAVNEAWLGRQCASENRAVGLEFLLYLQASCVTPS